MKKLAKLTLLAGAAFAPAAIFAQTVAPPVAWEDVPDASIGAAPQAGVTWQRPSSAAKASPPAFRAAPAMPAPLPAPEAVPQEDVQLAMARGGGGGHGGMGMRGGMGMHGGMQMRGGMGAHGGMQMHQGGGMQMHHGGGMQMGGHVSHPPVFHGGSRHFGGKHGNFQRMHKGSRMNNFWFGSRFRVNNWSMYGFSAPPPGWFWIRYYDDALLLDGSGMVRDYRGDFDWDRYGDRWEDDGNGVPGYGAAYGGSYVYGGQPGAYPWGYTITETTTVTTGGGRTKTVTRRMGGKPHHVRRSYGDYDEGYDRGHEERDESWREDEYREDHSEDYRQEDFGAPYDDLPPPPPPPEPIPQGELG